MDPEVASNRWNAGRSSKDAAGNGDSDASSLSQDDLGITPSRRIPTSFEELIVDLGAWAEQRDEIAFGAIIEHVGTRSFGPLLLLCGVIAFSPLSAIPTVPTTIATVVVVIAVQLLLHRQHFWLPTWVLARNVPSGKFGKGLRLLRRPARCVDRVLQQRLCFLTGSVGRHVIAVLCIVIALTMPFLELMPFAATIWGAVLVVFGLALLARDGLLALIASISTVLGVGFVVSAFLG